MTPCELTPPNASEWVKLVGDNGAMIVITGVVIMLVTWGIIFVTVKLFGENGVVWWAANRLMGEGGYVDRVVTEHSSFVSSVREVNAKIVESQDHATRKIVDSHEFNIAVAETGVDMAEKAAQKAGMGEEMQEYIERIRYLIAVKSASHGEHNG